MIAIFNVLRYCRLLALCFGALLLTPLLLGVVAASRSSNFDFEERALILAKSLLVPYLLSLFIFYANALWFQFKTKTALYAFIILNIIFFGHALTFVFWLVRGTEDMPVAPFAWIFFALIDLLLIPSFLILLNVAYLHGEKNTYIWGGFVYSLTAAHLMYGPYLFLLFKWFFEKKVYQNFIFDLFSILVVSLLIFFWRRM